MAVEPAWRPPSLLPGERVTEYVGTNTMRIDVPNSRADALMVSSWPLVAKNDAGVRAPVDTSLEEVAGGWRAANVEAKTRIGKKLGDGLVLGDGGQNRLAVRTAGRPATVGQLIDSKIFFANSDLDTDTIVEATPNGASIAWTVRSPKASESQFLSFDLPDGFSVKLLGDGLVFVRGSLVAGRVSPPIATDAQGSPVDVRYVVKSTGEVEVKTKHRKRDVAYPIAVDPVIWHQNAWQLADPGLSDTGSPYYSAPLTALDPNPTSSAVNGWRFASNNMVGANGGWTPSYGVSGRVLEIRSNSATSGWGGFEMQAPNDSFISRAELRHVDHDSGMTLMTAGLYDWYGASGFYETEYNSITGYSAYYDSTGAYYPWITTCADAGCDVGAGTPGNFVKVQLDKYASSSSPAYGGFDGGYLFLRDDDLPEITSVTGFSDGWINSNSVSGTVSASDAGLGLRQITGSSGTYWSSTCSGGAGGRCPTSVSQAAFNTGTLPEGFSEFSFTAQDIIARTHTFAVDVLVDTQAPSIKLSDALWARKSRTLTRKTPLRVRAIDPNSSIAVPTGSGIKQVVIKEKPGPLSGSGTWEQKLATDSCSDDFCGDADVAWEFDPATHTAGSTYSIRVEAVDQAGNAAPLQEFEVTVATGAITSLDEGTKTARRVKLEALANTTGQTSVRFQWRRPSPSCDDIGDCWVDIPASDVTQARDQAVASWPLSLTARKSPTLTWDVAETTDASGSGAYVDGDVQVRAEFAGGIAGTSQEVTVGLDRSGVKTKNSTEGVGPGSVDLLTGNFAHSTTDVSIESPIADLSIARTYNSRVTTDGPLGPGWQLSLPVPQANAQFVRLHDETARDGTAGYLLESVTATRADGSVMVFEGVGVTADNATSVYQPANGDDDYDLTRKDGVFSLTDRDGNVTTFKANGSSTVDFVISQVKQSGGETAVGYGYDPNNPSRVTWVFAPHPTGAKCSIEFASELDPECRALHMSYDGNGKLSTVALSTAVKDGSGYSRNEQPIAEYTYSSGKLVEAWDPRISPALKTAYAYDGDGKLQTITPAGEQPWTLDYVADTPSGADDTDALGRLKKVSRPTLDSSGNPDDPAETTVVYDVPRSGGSAPYAMGESTTATWGQNDLPAAATAIFPPDQVPASPPSSYSKATVFYMDAFGYTVNEATPGGRITTTEHDRFSNVVRELTARNRERALAASATATESRRLDTQRVYSSDGKDLLEELGPQHSVKRESGQTVDGRKHTTITYDEGKPSSLTGPLHLATTTTAGLRLSGLLDDFNRADGSLNSGDWSQLGSAPAAISSNRAASSAGVRGSYWDASTFGPDSEVHATVAVPGGQFALYARLNLSSGITGYEAGYDGNAFRLWKVVGGTWTEIGSPQAYTVSAGDLVSFRVVGTSLSVRVNGTQVHSGTNGDITAAGYIGFELGTTVRLDDFGGGTWSGTGDVDVRTTQTGYAPASGPDDGPTSGWTLRKPTSVRVDPAGLNLTSKTQYNARGQVVLESRPKDTAGTTAGTTLYRYWEGSSACIGRRDWAGMLCQTAPAGATPALPTTSLYYNRLGQVVRQLETVVNGPSRTERITYDAAGRKLREETDGVDLGDGVLGWWKADAITGLESGDQVEDWADSSGNGRTLSQATSSKQPTYRLVGRVAPPDGPVVDDANRADSSTVGNGWATPSGFAAPRIVSNRIAAPASGTWSTVTRSASAADQQAFATVTTAHASDGAGLLLRLNPSTGNGYSVWWSGGTLYISRLNSWGDTSLKTISNVDLTSGDVVGARIVGSTITAFVKHSGAWRTVGTATDSTHTAAANYGFAVEGTTIRIDDIGGNGIAPPDGPVVDDANRADSSSLGNGWSTPGGFAAPRTVSDRFAAHSAGTWSVTTRSAGSATDQQAFATVSTAHATEGVGLLLRFNASTGNGYSLWWGNGNVYIHRTTSWGDTSLKTVSGVSLNSGDVIGARIVGSTITAFLKRGGAWSTVATATDSTYTAAAGFGFALNGTTNRLDDVGAGPSGPEYASPVSEPRPVVRHDGSDDLLEMSSGITTAKTVFVVASWNDSPQSDRPLLGDSTAYDFFGGSSDGTGFAKTKLWYSPTVNSKINGGATRINGTAAASLGDVEKPRGELQLIQVETNGSDMLAFNRTTGDRSYTDRLWSGDYAEIIAYDRVLSSGDREKIEDYLARKYDLRLADAPPTSTDAGASLPATGYRYSTTTGRLIETSSAGKLLTRDYDALGRLISYTDADGQESETTYDDLDRPVTFADGKGTQTFHYDGDSDPRPLLWKIEDTQLGGSSTPITGTFDADGRMTHQELPGGLDLRMSYDAAGDVDRRCYTRQSQCDSQAWFDLTAVSNIHGQTVTESTTNLGTRRHSYDAAARLTKTEDDPDGSPDCVTRVYSFDANSNRTGVASQAGSGSACSAPSPNTSQHSYDDADRLTDTGTVYDGFGRTLTTTAANAGGSTLFSRFYVNDLVRSLAQSGTATTLLLDPGLRPRLRQKTGQVEEVHHYSDDTDNPSWTAQGSSYERSITGLDGDLVASYTSASGATLVLTDLHGDTIGETTTATNTTAPSGKRDQDEFGVPDGSTSAKRFEWLGAKQRQTQTATGVITMGARVYVPQIGRFLQVDPVRGGSANDYDYANQDPVNNEDLDGRATVKTVRLSPQDAIDLGRDMIIWAYQVEEHGPSVPLPGTLGKYGIPNALATFSAGVMRQAGLRLLLAGGQASAKNNVPPKAKKKYGTYRVKFTVHFNYKIVEGKAEVEHRPPRKRATKKRR